MNAEDKTLQKFNSYMLRTKTDVLESLEDYIAYFKEHGLKSGFTPDTLPFLLDTCTALYDLIKEGNVHTLTEPWYCYEYNYYSDGITLDLIYYEEITYNDEDIIDATSSYIKSTCYAVKYKTLTPAEYAAQNHVKPATVYQWIRQGKLHTANKIGNRWHIPALLPKPAKSYGEPYYEWMELPDDIAEQFPFLSGTDNVSIDRNREGDYGLVSFYDSQTESSEDLPLPLADCERLEYMLIASPLVHCTDILDSAQYVFYKR